MHVLEILNSYPGETFIQEHARAVIQHTDIQLSWAFWQNNRPGTLKDAVPGLKNCVGLINPNRLSKIKKAGIKLAYLNDEDSYVKALKRQVKALKPDVIHFHFASLAVQHYKWVLDLGIPFTFSIRGSDIKSQTLISKEYVEHLCRASELALRVHSVSDHLKREYFNFCGENNKTVTIRTVIGDYWKKTIRNPIKGNLLAVGRLHWIKGYPDLLVACGILKKNDIKFRLTIIGEGEQRPMLEYMIRDLNLMDHVTLVGALNSNEIMNFFTKTDILVIASLAEGFPNVAGEAAFSGVPIVATKSTNITEIFEEEKDVKIASTGNPAHLAECIMSLLFSGLEHREKMTESVFYKAELALSPSRHAQDFRLFWPLN